MTDDGNDLDQPEEMSLLGRLVGLFKYGTTDPAEIKCQREGHKWELVGKTRIQVPEGEKETFGEIEDDDIIVEEGPPLPDGLSTWAPIETSNQQCSRCGEYRTRTFP